MANHYDFTAFDDEFQKPPPAGGSEEVPDGKYVVKVEKAFLAKAKTSGAAMLKWYLKILEGKHAGRMLFRNNMLATRENVAFLKRDLTIAEIEIGKLSELENSLGKFLDVKLEVTKKSRGDFYNVYLNKRLGMAAANDEPGERRAQAAGDDDIPF